MNQSVSQLLSHAIALQTAGQKVIACLLVKARGSTPQSAGALMLVDELGNTLGTIGGGCVEAEIRRRALELLQLQAFSLVRFKLDHDYGWDDGLICGGTIDVVIAPLPSSEILKGIVDDIKGRRATMLTLSVAHNAEPLEFQMTIPPRDRLFIAGAGHVGQALAALALRLDFDVTLFDDRADLLQRLAPPGCALVDGDIAQNLRQAPFDDHTWAVIVTRGHRHDEQALAAVLNRGAVYVGMIGSRRKIKLIFDDLVATGVPSSSLQNIHAPIGLDIGAVTVEEIALSIAAELVQVRRQTIQSPVQLPGGFEAVIAGQSASTLSTDRQ
jgi:xanthine dehydrogenase accessory factor